MCRATGSAATSSSTSTTSSTSRLRLPCDRATRCLPRNTSGRVGGLRPRVRGRPRAGGDGVRADGVVPRVPGSRAPDARARRACCDMGIGGPLAADQDGYPGILGYQGPALSEVMARASRRSHRSIESMMVRKSEAEVALIRESARWCEHAHRLLQQYTKPGATEAQASLQAGHEATLAMLEQLGAAYGGQQASSDGVSAGYRGQIGSGARGRTLSPTTSSSVRATSSSRRRALRSGATTPSSSARSSSARRPTKCGACSITRSPHNGSPSTHCAPASPAPTSTARC